MTSLLYLLYNKIRTIGKKLNKERFEKIKSLKPFGKKDIVVYAILLAIVIALFSVLIFLNHKSPTYGFQILIDNEKALTFDFATRTASVSNQYQDKVYIDYSNEKIIVYFYDSRIEFNEISFNSARKTVEISDSTCSLSKDCVYMPKIVDDKGVIYCAPHALKILPLGEKLSNSPITG